MSKHTLQTETGREFEAIETADVVVPEILDARPETEALARECADALAISTFSSGRPGNSVAAACVYCAKRITGDANVIQKDVAEATGVVPITVRNHWPDVPEAYIEAEVLPEVVDSAE